MFELILKSKKYVMKRYWLLVCLLILFVNAVDAQQPFAKRSNDVWNSVYNLWNAKVVDEYKGVNDWKLVIGESKNDKANNQGEANFQNTLLLVNPSQALSVALPHFGYTVMHAWLYIDREQSQPKYVFYTLAEYVTDYEIYRYEISTGQVKKIHSGDIKEILPSGNILIYYSGFSKDPSKVGRGFYDAIINKEGKLLWVSEFYYG